MGRTALPDIRAFSYDCLCGASVTPVPQLNEDMITTVLFRM
jgi:hypothetical protein